MKPHLIFLIAAVPLGVFSSRLAAVDVPSANEGYVSCKVDQTVKPVYPLRLLNDGVTYGEARIALQIDPSGQLTDTLVVAYTHKGFADEALRVVPQWKFTPAQIDGRPAGSVVEVEFTFRMKDIVVVPSNPTKEEPILAAGQYQFKPATLKQLDRIPTPVHIEPPFYPTQWAERGIKGRATVEFFIDEAGHVRMPAVIASDHPLLAGAATEAVKQWNFEPPTEKGRPALVKAQQVFTFGSE